MSDTNGRSKAQSVGTYGTSEKFTGLRQDLTTAPAWLTLKDSAARILIDFIRVYNIATNYDRDPTAATRPILYTFGMCAVTCSKNTFYRAMLELQEHGFLQGHWHHKRRRGQAQRWIASERWKHWRPDQAQLRILNDYNDRRGASCENPAQMQMPFVQRLAALNSAASRQPGNIVTVGQVMETMMEDACTKNGSPHPRPLNTLFAMPAKASSGATTRNRRTSFGE
jgi:hypothetical protein